MKFKTKKIIDASGPFMSDLEEKYVIQALRNGMYDENKYYFCEKFENDFSRFHNRKYGLMTPSCTTALHLLFLGLGFDGGNVLVPECTWIASICAAKHCGLELRFCDIEKDTLCISEESIRNNVDENTKAIIAVNIYGNPVRYESIKKICKEKNIFLIEDSAQSYLSIYRNKKMGSFGDASVFSFHRTKSLLSTGEGGILLIDDDKLYERCKFLRDHGRDYKKAYSNLEIAWKYMPNNITSAVALAQFERREELLKIKRYQFEYYRNYFSNIKNIQFNYDNEEHYNCGWTTTMIFNDCKLHKEELVRRLNRKMGSNCFRPIFYPLSSLPAIDKKEEYENKNINSYNILDKGINLPGDMRLDEHELEDICKNIMEEIKK